MPKIELNKLKRYWYVPIFLLLLAFGYLWGHGQQNLEEDTFDKVDGKVVKIIKTDRKSNEASLDSAEGSQKRDAEATDQVGETSASPRKTRQTIVVHVAGAVEKPGVYEMQEDDRIYQAVEKAKPKAEADINLLNLASHLSDGQKIIVPKKGERLPSESPGQVQATMGEGSGEKISINQATKEALKTLPGIGDKRADDIIAYREAHGGFKKLEDLKEVGGIGEKTYEKLKDKISL